MSIDETQEEVVEEVQKNSEATLKLLRNKTHIGPASVGKATLASLSKAAGRVVFDSNLKITIKETETEIGKVKDPTKGNEVTLIELNQDCAAEEAALYLLAWDKLYHSVGTNAYQKKYQEFVQKQTSVYAELGLVVKPTDKKPELTEQQRRMYNDKMRPFAFSYFEYRLSFKQPGKKAVRSLTYRSLKPMDAEDMIAKLCKQAGILEAKLLIEIRK